MQAESESYSEFSERTEVLSRKLGARVSDLPAEIGVSASMFFAYRAGKYPISRKAWGKLEAAERAAAENNSEAENEPFRGAGIARNAESERELEFKVRAKPKFFSAARESRLVEMQAAVAELQSQAASLQAELAEIQSERVTLGEMIEGMAGAGAWPPTEADQALTPAEIFRKYSQATDDDDS